MRIASNKIADILRFFREELSGVYELNELETIIGFCFEEYLGMKRADLALKGNDQVSESELLKFNSAVKDLKKHKPIQYILGKADFYGLKLKVNEHVLIPRPETEELVDRIIKEFQACPPKRRISILDIGTGSGCIPIALKKNIPAAAVFGIDISEKALEVARQNAVRNKQEVIFVSDDILNPQSFLFKSRSFDIIVSNPPYVSVSEKKQMQRNVLEYEPHLALFVPDNEPLLFYNRIAEIAFQSLKTNGKLYFEINPEYSGEIKLLLEKTGFKNVLILKDLNNKNRILQGAI